MIQKFHGGLSKNAGTLTPAQDAQVPLLQKDRAVPESRARWRGQRGLLRAFLVDGRDQVLADAP
ncbi:MAG: hypothetical protein RSE46_11910, partial [Janthinobacterium sp.]